VSGDHYKDLRESVMNGPQFDEYAVPGDLADAQDEDLGQAGGRHRRLSGPRLARTRGRIESVAAAIAVLTAVLIGLAHGSTGGADRGTPAGATATATPSPSLVVACVIARGWYATDEHADTEDGSVRTRLPSCPTDEWRAAQSTYLARLLAQQAAAKAGPAASPGHSG
jgi:hypothetical protein